MKTPLIVKTKDGQRGVIIGMKVNSDTRSPVSFTVKMPDGEVRLFSMKAKKSSVETLVLT